MVDVELPGCRPEPLGSYLKAVGLHRLVATQADPLATGRWSGDSFVLGSALDHDGLIGFIVDQYAPTPLLAPWNKGSGFGPDDATKSPTAFAAVETIASSTTRRLAAYRSAIEVARGMAASLGWSELSKIDQVSRCRGLLPDEAVEWLDASVVLTSDRLHFPPILGTGGNDGRFDFGSNFMGRLAEMLGLTVRRRGASTSKDLARAALLGESMRLDLSAIGQFDPVGAGGPASSPLGNADSLANPWDFILALEGALLFASAAARRLGATMGVPSVPFMVSASAAGMRALLTRAPVESCGLRSGADRRRCRN